MRQLTAVRIAGMRLRDSGMPEEAYWESLFDVPLVLARLGIDSRIVDVTELGCGYGTFTLPIARAIRGVIHSFDVEPAMVHRTSNRAAAAGIQNMICREWDVMERGFDVPAPVDAALLFNILHCDEPVRLIRHAAAAIRPGGSVLAIHWRYDATTPRGPSLDIRPRPEQMVAWAHEAAGLVPREAMHDLPPWHYGFAFIRPGRSASPR